MGTRRDPLGLSAWRNMAHRTSSRAPVHSVLVQKSVTTSTNLAGRLSSTDARKTACGAQGAINKKLAGVLLGTKGGRRNAAREKMRILVANATGSTMKMVQL